MPNGPQDSQAWSRYATIGQSGFMMAAPIGLGAFADSQWETGPWLTIGGALLGLFGGMAFLVHSLNAKSNDRKQP